MRSFRSTSARLAKQLGLRRAGGLFESEYLRSLGFDVRTVIDVGVDRGTKPLYDAFNDCLFVLVDPRHEAESMLRDKPGRYVFINKALAATAGQRILREQEAGKTTFLERTALTASPTIAKYEVDATTLDELLDLSDCKPPIGIKIDTEGYELEVMRGLTRHWDSVQFVICEASIRKRFIDSYQMSELVSYMLERDFMLFNFLNEVDRRPRYYDIIFVPKTSCLLE
jgi:FkbM family methyltransferase